MHAAIAGSVGLDGTHTTAAVVCLWNSMVFEIMKLWVLMVSGGLLISMILIMSSCVELIINPLYQTHIVCIVLVCVKSNRACCKVCVSLC
jgi:hypothetical protein